VWTGDHSDCSIQKFGNVNTAYVCSVTQKLQDIWKKYLIQGKHFILLYNWCLTYFLHWKYLASQVWDWQRNVGTASCNTFIRILWTRWKLKALILILTAVLNRRLKKIMLWLFFIKLSNIKPHEYSSNGFRASPCLQTDRWTGLP
jgi:hypothetical protein